jgi:hypothetical protein
LQQETTVPGLFSKHPLLIATSAASGGVLLGAYVAFQIFAAPVEQYGPGTPAPKPVAEANASDVAAPAGGPETTGSAPSKDDVATMDRCGGQTWPNLSRDCMEQMQSRKPARTATTDRVEKPAPDAQAAPPQQANNAPAAAPPPNAPNTTIANAPSIASVPPAPAPASNAVAPWPPAVPPANNQTAAAPPAAAQPVAAPSNPPDVAPDMAAAAPVNDAAASAKPEKRKVKEAKRKSKKPKTDEFDDRALAYAPGNDRDGAQADRADRDRADRERFDRNDRRSLRAEGRGRDGWSDRSRRERVVRGEDDDDDGDRVSTRGDRRVIVIRRERESGGGIGGLFENLFGN